MGTGAYFSKRVDSLKPWVLHLRADSSPQYGRDFMISQRDIIQYGRDIHTTSIQKRLLPIQCIGSKAAGASQKLSKLVHSLALESEHVPRLATVNHLVFFLRTMVIHMFCSFKSFLFLSNPRLLSLLRGYVLY